MNIGDNMKTIGAGWPTDEAERAKAIREQEELVSLMAAIEEQFEIWELDT